LQYDDFIRIILFIDGLKIAFVLRVVKLFADSIF